MEHKRCYVYEPDGERTAKRQRVAVSSGLHKSWPARRKHFEKQWNALNLTINEALAAANDPATKHIRDFTSVARERRQQGRLPACIVSIEPGSRAKDVFTSLIATDASWKSERHSVLQAADAPDLKSALKKVVRDLSATTIDDEDLEESKEEQPRKHRPNTLPYDLQLVADELDDTQLSQCLVTISDAEAFRPDVLSELIEYLALWLDQIPFVLVVCCAVPIYMLQRALTQRALRRLDSEVFHAASRQDELEIVLDCTINSEWDHLFIGPGLMRSFLQRQHDYLADVSSFVESWKYAVICAHYANPLVALSMPNSDFKPTADICEALRTTASFKTWTEALLESGQHDLVTHILDRDDKLISHIRREVRQNTQLVKHMYRTVKTLADAQKLVSPEREALTSSLWLQCLAGSLSNSTSLRHFYLGVRKASSSVLRGVLLLFEDVITSDDELDHAQSVADSLLELKAKLEAEEAGDTQVVDMTIKTPASLNADVASLLEDFLTKTLQNPKDLLFQEIFLYDSLSPCREVLTPRPRHAVERALASPHDYLDCDCCAPESVQDHGSLSATQPATAVLYQLYLESGNMLNVHDAWQAFSTIMGEERTEELKMALFQRSLAELRHLGTVKSTRRRIDHIAKIAWKGL